MTRWVARQLGPDVPVHFTAFRPNFGIQDRPLTPPQTLARVRRIALDNGIRYAYTGNVHDPAGQSTRCHKCVTLLIERDWYRCALRCLPRAGVPVLAGPPCRGSTTTSPSCSPGERTWWAR